MHWLKYIIIFNARTSCIAIFSDVSTILNVYAYKELSENFIHRHIFWLKILIIIEDDFHKYCFTW